MKYRIREETTQSGVTQYWVERRINWFADWWTVKLCYNLEEARDYVANHTPVSSRIVT